MATNQTSSDNETGKDSEILDIRPILSTSRGTPDIEVNAENLDDIVELAIYSLIDSVQSSEQLKTLKGQVDNNPEIITDVFIIIVLWNLYLFIPHSLPLSHSISLLISLCIFMILIYIYIIIINNF